MVTYVNNPPDAGSLMMSARSYGSYDLAAAVADLIDNSLKAGARKVELECDYNDGQPVVRVRDDGHGMSREELHAAMRPASQNPSDERSPDDLGRFGWGLKSASFSQCRELTVVSTVRGKTNGAQWDLKDIQKWRMGVLSMSDIRKTASDAVFENDGTEVVWTDCDRLSENGTLSEDEFNALIVTAKNRLSLIFHRYLAGTVRGRNKKFSIFMSGVPLEARDPYFADHPACWPLPEEKFRLKGRLVHVKPYILPHASKLKPAERERMEGEEGHIRNQGFYLYRSSRLIIHGTWFGLAKHGELSQLVRIRVDIPNSLDELWKLTVDKANAQLPAELRTRLGAVIERTKKNSSRVVTGRGARPRGGERIPVWLRHVKSGEITYLINRQHPLIAILLENGSRKSRRDLDMAIRAVEQAFPVGRFGRDTTASADSILQNESDPVLFQDFLRNTVPVLLQTEAGGDLKKLEKLLRRTEPYFSQWGLVTECLKEMGWEDG